jgi:hypothetical protein
MLVDLDQPLPGDLSQPRVERQRLVTQVVVELFVSLDQYVLNDVGGIEPTKQAAVQTDADHLAQAITVANQQGLTRRVIATGAAQDQFVSVGRSRSHGDFDPLRLTCGIVA